MFRFGYNLWSRVACTRKPFDCILCQKTHPAGSVAYRPLTNGKKRWQRICEECGNKRATI